MSAPEGSTIQGAAVIEAPHAASPGTPAEQRLNAAYGPAIRILAEAFVDAETRSPDVPEGADQVVDCGLRALASRQELAYMRQPGRDTPEDTLSAQGFLSLAQAAAAAICGNGATTAGVNDAGVAESAPIMPAIAQIYKVLGARPPINEAEYFDPEMADPKITRFLAPRFGRQNFQVTTTTPAGLNISTALQGPSLKEATVQSVTFYITPDTTPAPDQSTIK